MSEARLFKALDGAGRVRATASTLPGRGDYISQLFVYDVMGRLAQQSNPAETNAAGTTWTTIGEDAASGWIYATETYDWRAARWSPAEQPTD